MSKNEQNKKRIDELTARMSIEVKTQRDLAVVMDAMKDLEKLLEKMEFDPADFGVVVKLDNETGLRFADVDKFTGWLSSVIE